MAATGANPAPHVAVFPSPGLGHITPVLELTRRLVSLHHLRVTIFVITTDASPAQSRLLRSAALPDGLSVVELPPSSEDPVSPDARAEARMSIIVRDSLPALRSALRRASPPPAALVVDIFGTDAFDVADEVGIPGYLFFTTTAAVFALMMHLPVLDREIEGEYTDLPSPVEVPGCVPVRVADLLDPLVHERKDPAYQWYLHHCKRFPLARGVLVNTWEAVEKQPLAALREQPDLAGIFPRPPVYPVGPIVQSPANHPAGSSECLQWLDSQPPGSVLYVSFGSGGTLSGEQTAELAAGLESSQRRFLWVVRRPTATEAGTFFTSGEGAGEALDYLPEGFLRRTEGRGLVVPSWAPQRHILGHPVVGGFLTHCGWNSVLESVAAGVPMIGWPLYAEQSMNATMLEEELKVGFRVRPEGGVVRKVEIERVVRLLMQGEEGAAARARVAELSRSAAAAVGEGGSSWRSLAAVVGQWRLGR